MTREIVFTENWLYREVERIQMYWSVKLPVEFTPDWKRSIEGCDIPEVQSRVCELLFATVAASQ